jgi:3-deoxy-D-manno-octulosonate 8-phosphate phosphatase (KDO 8-P phosphatase)
MNQTFSLIVYDFDGVMTDNRVLTLEDGTEGVFVSRSDGWAIARIRDLGIPQVIISTEENPVVAARAAKLNLEAIHGVGDKATVLTQYAARHGLNLDRAAFLGNDVNDLGAMRLVGTPVAPADSHPDIRAIAARVLNANGGAHAIREFYETMILSKMTENPDA